MTLKLPTESEIVLHRLTRALEQIAENIAALDELRKKRKKLRADLEQRRKKRKKGRA